MTPEECLVKGEDALLAGDAKLANAWMEMAVKRQDLIGHGLTTAENIDMKMLWEVYEQARALPIVFVRDYDHKYGNGQLIIPTEVVRYPNIHPFRQSLSKADARFYSNGQSGVG